MNVLGPHIEENTDQNKEGVDMADDVEARGLPTLADHSHGDWEVVVNSNLLVP